MSYRTEMSLGASETVSTTRKPQSSKVSCILMLDFVFQETSNYTELW